MYVFGSGRCGWRGGEWMRELDDRIRERWGDVMSV